MRDNQSYTIGVLSITAAVLLVGVILIPDRAGNSAMAFGQLDRGGDYIILTGQFNENSELIYITDAAARRLNVYSYDPTTRQIIVWDSVDMARLDMAARPPKKRK